MVFVPRWMPFVSFLRHSPSHFLAGNLVCCTCAVYNTRKELELHVDRNNSSSCAPTASDTFPSPVDWRYSSSGCSTSWARQGAAITVAWLCPAPFYVFGCDFLTRCGSCPSQRMESLPLCCFVLRIRQKGVHPQENMDKKGDTAFR